MADRISKANRSKIMAAIRGRDTQPELAVGKILRKFGVKARKNPRTPLGRPDFLLPGIRTAVFVHGCFWHAHSHCPFAKAPKSRRSYWIPKLRANRSRDLRKLKNWRTQGWRVRVIWACALNNMDGPYGFERRLRASLKSKRKVV